MLCFKQEEQKENPHLGHLVNRANPFVKNWLHHPSVFHPSFLLLDLLGQELDSNYPRPRKEHKGSDDFL